MRYGSYGFRRQRLPALPDSVTYSPPVCLVWLRLNLEHPNIVRIHDYGRASSEGPLYLTMEYLDGPNLRKFTERSHRLVLCQSLVFG